MKGNKLKQIYLEMVLILFICVGVGYTTAYYRVNITYEDNKPEDNIVNFASNNSIDVTFDGGSPDLALENVLPGDSVSKTYTLTNNSSTTILYTVNLSNITNNFVNKDIVYSLYEITDDEETVLVQETTLPSTQTDSINLVECLSIEKNTTKKYKLVLHYLETNTDQSEDMGKEASASISLGEFNGTKCPTNITKLLSTITNVNGILSTPLDGTVVDETEDKNIRYIGADPNNYIWFNCYDYSDTSTCERWRIIGLMNNVLTDKVTKNLLKIIRADEITDTTGGNAIYWDYTTSGEKANVWDNGDGRSTLRSVLNDAYYGTSTVTTYNSKTYTYSSDSSNTTLPRGITTQTLDKIEKVKWNVTPAEPDATANTIYTTTGTTWSGYIGLMDPSDFGFATSGGDTGRSSCIGESLYEWSSDSDCYNNSWIRYYNPTEEKNSGSLHSTQWTIRPYSGDSRNALLVYSVGDVSGELVHYTYSVRPTLYLSSNIFVLSDGETDGSYEKPYLVK